MSNNTIKGLDGLAALAQLKGLVVKETAPPTTAELAAELAAAEQAAQTQAAKLRAQDTVRVMRETKGRAGKAVTLVKGITATAQELETIAAQLKTACASGGTVKDGMIAVQGDHVERVMAALAALGYKPKRAGG